MLGVLLGSGVFEELRTDRVFVSAIILSSLEIPVICQSLSRIKVYETLKDSSIP